MARKACTIAASCLPPLFCRRLHAFLPLAAAFTPPSELNFLQLGGLRHCRLVVYSRMRSLLPASGPPVVYRARATELSSFFLLSIFSYFRLLLIKISMPLEAFIFLRLRLVCWRACKSALGGVQMVGCAQRGGEAGVGEVERWEVWCRCKESERWCVWCSSAAECRRSVVAEVRRGVQRGRNRRQRVRCAKRRAGSSVCE